jgi:hypothetical protein
MDAKNAIVERALATIRALNASEPRPAPETLPETRPAAEAVLAETPAACPQFTLWEPGARCWHCGGCGLCRCIVCDAGPGAEPQAGPCTICGGSGSVPAKVQ